MNCEELLVVPCCTTLHPCSIPLGLCWFSGRPQRTLVLSSSNTRPGLPPCHVAECSGVHRPSWLPRASFALRQQPGKRLVRPGMWPGKGFSYQAEQFSKAGGSSPSGVGAVLPSHLTIISPCRRCGHAAIQPPTLHRLPLKNGPKPPVSKNGNAWTSRARTSPGSNIRSPRVELVLACSANGSVVTNV